MRARAFFPGRCASDDARTSTTSADCVRSSSYNGTAAPSRTTTRIRSIPVAASRPCSNSEPVTPRTAPGASTSKVVLATCEASRYTASTRGRRKRPASNVHKASIATTRHCNDSQTPSATAPGTPNAGEPGSAFRPVHGRPACANTSASSPAR